MRLTIVIAMLFNTISAPVAYAQASPAHQNTVTVCIHASSGIVAPTVTAIEVQDVRLGKTLPLSKTRVVDDLLRETDVEQPMPTGTARLLGRLSISQDAEPFRGIQLEAVQQCAVYHFATSNEELLILVERFVQSPPTKWFKSPPDFDHEEEMSMNMKQRWDSLSIPRGMADAAALTMAGHWIAQQLTR